MVSLDVVMLMLMLLTKFFSPPLRGTLRMSFVPGMTRSGTERPSSSQTRRPQVMITAPAAQSIKEAPALPVAIHTLAGVTKIPEPDIRNQTV